MVVQSVSSKVAKELCLKITANLPELFPDVKNTLSERFVKTWLYDTSASIIRV